MSARFDSSTAVLSTVLIAFSSGGILLDSAHLNNPWSEAAWRRSSSQLLDRGAKALLDPGTAAAQQTAEDFREALSRDMAFPYRWCDLGEALMLSGRIEDARYCFSRAVELAPHSPMILMRAANFQFRTDHPSNALPYTSRILALIPDYDSVIFLSYARAELPPEQVLREGLPQNSRAVGSYFAYVLANGTPESAAKIWEWMRSRKFSDDPLAGRYLQSLLHNHRYTDAVRMWTDYLGPRRGPYPESNLLFNGDFENEPSGAVLDWTPGQTEHVAEQRDSGVFHSGKWSLRVGFDGSANVDYRGASQIVVVAPGRYRFTAAVRTNNVTTNRGIGFRLFDPESPSRLDVKTESLTGSSEWVTLTMDIVAPPGTNLINIQLYRLPSEKFDNKIAGTAWVDSVALSALTSARGLR